MSESSEETCKFCGFPQWDGQSHPGLNNPDWTCHHYNQTHIIHDSVDHPPHYNEHPSGIEAITICEHMTFNVGNAVKYLWRHGDKGNPIEDLHKAAWYVNREIARLEEAAKQS